jgi:hypothetical protein
MIGAKLRVSASFEPRSPRERQMTLLSLTVRMPRRPRWTLSSNHSRRRIHQRPAQGGWEAFQGRLPCRGARRRRANAGPVDCPWRPPLRQRNGNGNFPRLGSTKPSVSMRGESSRHSAMVTPNSRRRCSHAQIFNPLRRKLSSLAKMEHECQIPPGEAHRKGQTTRRNYE